MSHVTCHDHFVGSQTFDGSCIHSRVHIRVHFRVHIASHDMTRCGMMWKSILLH